MPISACGISASRHVPTLPALAAVEAEQLATPAGDDLVDAGGELARSIELHPEDRLQQHRGALGQSFAHADASRRLEGHVGTVDRMEGAIGQRHLDVDQREAEGTALQAVHHAFLDPPGRSSFGTAPPVTTSAKGEALAALLRLDGQHAIAELTVTTRLLLVATAHGGRRLDGLPVGNDRIARHHGNAEPVLQGVRAERAGAFPPAPRSLSPPCRRPAQRPATDLPQRGRPRAVDNLTSSLASLGATTMEMTGDEEERAAPIPFGGVLAGRQRQGRSRRDRPCRCRPPPRRTPRAPCSAFRSRAYRGPDTRPVAPSAAVNARPSVSLPESTRTMESLPACDVCTVLATWTMVSGPIGEPKSRSRFLDAGGVMAQRLQKAGDAVTPAPPSRRTPA